MIADLLDKAAHARVFSQNEILAIMHVAAARLVGESVADPQKYQINNVSGSLSLLAVLPDAGYRRIVSSSAAADCGHADSAGELSFCADHSLWPLRRSVPRRRRLDLAQAAHPRKG